MLSIFRKENRLIMTNEFISALNSVNPQITTQESENLIKDGIIDSLDVMKVVVKLAETYGIEFKTDDISTENFSSVQSMWNIVERIKARSK